MRSDGETCHGCGSSEAQCAREDCECCEACTHTFTGGELHKFLCFGCCRIITTDKQLSGRGASDPRRLCRLCALLRAQGISHVA